jgi:fumarate reductase subunit D
MSMLSHVLDNEEFSFDLVFFLTSLLILVLLVIIAYFLCQMVHRCHHILAL